MSPCGVRFKVLLTIAFACVSSAGRAQGEEEKRSDLRMVLQGLFVYEKNCILCHGRRGGGDGEWAAAVQDKPRDFRKGVFKFRTTPMGYLPTDADLRRTIRNGISGTIMPVFAQLADRDVTAVIAYLKTLSPRWEDPNLQTVPVVLPTSPEWFFPQTKALATTRNAHLARGRERYTATCVMCHGAEGKGDGPASRGLVDTWGHAIAPATLARTTYKSGSKPQDLYRTIAMGLDGTPMVGFGKAFGSEQIWELVAYVWEMNEEAE